MLNATEGEYRTITENMLGRFDILQRSGELLPTQESREAYRNRGKMTVESTWDR